jgi:response regulator RpfG family c-di-GMP phosphodiesterase
MITEDIRNAAGEAGSEHATGGMRTKILAVEVAFRAGCRTVLADGRTRDVLTRIFRGEEIGTLFLAGTRMGARARWILGARPKGGISVDEGALKALERRKSLLPRGVVDVTGVFDIGDVVLIESGFHAVASMSSEEIRRVMGHHSSDVETILGPGRREEVARAEDIVPLITLYWINMCSLNEDEAWNVLIVDDEPEIHVLTKTVLKGVVFEDKPINFLSSYDAPGTKEILAGDTNIALVLMDVVMEEPHTGLDLVRHIREDLNNRLTRIILRTGQPGEAPERKIIAEYEINDYKEKIDLTSNRLFTSVVKSIRNYRDLKTIKDINEELEKSREGLTRMLRTSSGLFGLRSLESFHSELVKEAAVMMGRYGSMMLTGAGLETIVRAEGTWKDSIGATGIRYRTGNILKTVPDEFGSSTILLKEGFLFGRLTSVQGPVLYLISGVKQSPDEGEIRLLEIFLGNANIVYNNLSLEADFQATQSEMIGLLGDVIENRSQELQGHVSRVSEYAVFLARKAGISRRGFDGTQRRCSDA